VTVTSTAANALQVGVATAAALNGIPDTALVTLGAGSTLAMSATSETIGNLAGTGTVTTNAFAGTLSIGGKNVDATFAGLITEQTGFALSIAKVGSGKLTLTNVANAFTGNLTITGGTLELAGTAKVFAPAYNNTSVVTIGAGARLVVDELG
jgi:autotransporter-associated beta strand protein